MQKIRLGNALRGGLLGIGYPVSLTLLIRDTELETAWGPIHLTALFLLGWGMAACLVNSKAPARPLPRSAMLWMGAGLAGTLLVRWSVGSS